MQLSTDYTDLQQIYNVSYFVREWALKKMRVVKRNEYKGRMHINKQFSDQYNLFINYL